MTNLEPAQRPRRRSILLAVGGVAAALAIGVTVTVAASASPATSEAVVAALPTTSAAPTGTAAPSAPGTADPAVPAERPAHKPHLAGEVTAVSGTKISIKDHDGFTREIITSATTKYTDGLTASPAVGTRIAAEGTVAANGTSLNAETVGKAPEFGDRFGGPGGPGRGHGHFGGPGPDDGVVPPTAGPTTTQPSAPTSPAPTS